MTCANCTQFKHISHVGNSLLMNELEINLKAFLDWSFLQIGGFFNVTLPTSGFYGGTFDVLKYVHDGGFTDGQVWQGIRRDWIWESGVSYSGGSPIAITGVLVNGSGSTSSGTYSHYIDYPMGRVVFSGAISTSSTVRCAYSYRWVQVLQADNCPWWKQIQFGTYRPDDEQWGLQGSGVWAIGAEHRIQLPTILLEATPRRRGRPYEMGNSATWVYQDVLFHVIAETRWERNQLLDILAYQQDYTIKLFNSTNMLASGAYPLDDRGSLVSPTINYPYLVNNFPWKTCTLRDPILSEVQTVHPNLHIGTVRTTIELVLGDS